MAAMYSCMYCPKALCKTRSHTCKGVRPTGSKNLLWTQFYSDCKFNCNFLKCCEVRSDNEGPKQASRPTASIATCKSKFYVHCGPTSTKRHRIGIHVLKKVVKYPEAVPDKLIQSGLRDCRLRATIVR
jgi:hypothetical protein